MHHDSEITLRCSEVNLKEFLERTCLDDRVEKTFMLARRSGSSIMTSSIFMTVPQRARIRSVYLYLLSGLLFSWDTLTRCDDRKRTRWIIGMRLALFGLTTSRSNHPALLTSRSNLASESRCGHPEHDFAARTPRVW